MKEKVKTESKLDKQHVLNEVIKIARRAGEFIRHEGKNFAPEKIEEKGLNNLVSYVDIEAEQMIAQTLKFTLPDAGFITEEGTETEKSEDYNWVVDPLDGTTNFMHGLSPHSVSIALSYRDKTIIGVVYEITRDECFYATDESKSYLNRQEIKVSEVKNVSDGLFITGYPYKHFEDMQNFYNVLDHFMRNSHGIRRLGSAAADLCYVACGRSEGFFEYGLNPWDVAAGALIVQQAGGKVSDFKNGNDYIFGKEISAKTLGVHDEVLAVLQKHFK